MENKSITNETQINRNNLFLPKFGEKTKEKRRKTETHISGVKMCVGLVCVCVRERERECVCV